MAATVSVAVAGLICESMNVPLLRKVSFWFGMSAAVSVTLPPPTPVRVSLNVPTRIRVASVVGDITAANDDSTRRASGTLAVAVVLVNTTGNWGFGVVSAGAATVAKVVGLYW